MSATKRNAESTSHVAETPATPRLSSSLLLLNSRNEVLMIQRTNESRTFAGMHAFPGGNYDATQDGDDLRMTAIREAFEETGILLASLMAPPNTAISASALSQARKAIHSRTDPLTFPSFLAFNYLSPDPVLDYLIPFTQWITPTNAKSRFSTRFYIAFLDEVGNDVRVAEFESGLTDSYQETSGFGSSARIPVPTHDNHVEILSAYFQPLTKIIESFNQGNISLMPPQYYLLTTLSQLIQSHTKMEENTCLAAYIRHRVGRSFGGRVFNPKFGKRTIGDDGLPRAVLMYEGDEEYDDPQTRGFTRGREEKGGRHRSLVTFKDGRPFAIKIERTIDVFGPNDGRIHAVSTKL